MFLYSQVKETSSEAAAARKLGWRAKNSFVEAQTGHYLKRVIVEIRLTLVFLSCYILLKSHLNQNVQTLIKISGK